MTRTNREDASRNRLVLTNSTPFDALTELEVLDLSDNELSDLPPGLFRNLQKLTALSLAENALKVLPPGTFQGLQGLRRLDLHVAGLHELQQEAFRGLDSLGFLDLSQNSLCDLPDGSFGSLRHLKLLNLRRAQLLNPLSYWPSCDAWYWRKWKGKDVANTAYALGLWRQSADDHGEHRRCVVIDAIALDTHEYVNVLWAMSEFRVKGSHLCHVTRPLEPLCFRASRALQTSGHGKSTGQVNGPAHYALDLEHWDHHAEVGRSLLKRRLASERGYHFVTVPWWEWDQALRDRGGRRGYLQSLGPRHMTKDWGSACASPSDVRGQRSDSAEAETKPGYTPAGAPWSSNPLCEVTGAAFQNLSSLKVLDLANLCMDSMNRSFFEHVPDLMVFNISNNRLVELPDHLFVDASALLAVDLSQNRPSEARARIDVSGTRFQGIERVDANAFQGLRSLKVLEMEGNDVAELPGEVFSPLTSLERLSLADNRFVELGASTFRGLAALLCLDSSAADHKRLDLARNSLEQLHESVFNSLKQLAILDLSGNRLTGLQENMSL
eukprot:s4749_g1.t1